MGFARLVGQSLSDRLNLVRLMLAGATLAAGGALIVAAAVSPAMAYAGFIIMGLGASVIAPLAFSLVGSLSTPQQRTRAIAKATFFGYFGYFIGPPLTGFVAGSLGLPAAFVFAAAMLGTIWLFAPRLQTH